MNEITAFTYDTYWLGLRTTRRFFRVPANVISIIFFPLIQLLVFSQLFKDIVQLPAFATDSYLAYLAPGQVVFASFLAVGWAGYGMLVEYRTGYLDKLRATPIARTAILAGEMVPLFFEAAIIAGVLLGVSVLLGATLVDRRGRAAADPVPLRRVRHRLRRDQLHRRPAHQERAGGQRALAADVPGGLHLDGVRAGRADARVDAERQRPGTRSRTRSRRSAP